MQVRVHPPLAHKPIPVPPPDPVSRAGEIREDRRAIAPGEIDGKVEAPFPNPAGELPLPHNLPGEGEVLHPPVEHEHLVDVRVPLKDVLGAGMNKRAYPCPRKGFPKGPEYRGGEKDISDVPQLDHQDAENVMEIDHAPPHPAPFSPTLLINPMNSPADASMGYRLAPSPPLLPPPPPPPPFSPTLLSNAMNSRADASMVYRLATSPAFLPMASREPRQALGRKA